MADQDDEQDAERVAAADDRELEREQVAEREQPALERGKRRSPRNERNRRASNGQVQHLHRDRVVRDARHGEQAQVPQRRMTVVPHVPEESRQGASAAGDAPCLRLVEPHRMARQRKPDHGQVGEDQRDR